MSVMQTFNNMQPKHKRNVLAVAAVVLVLGVSWMLTSMTERKTNKSPRAEKPEVTVVAPARTTGVEQFNAKLGLLEKMQEDLRTKMERLQTAPAATPEAKLPDDASVLSGLDDIKLPEIPELTPQTSVFDGTVARTPQLPPAPPVEQAAPAAIAPEHAAEQNEPQVVVGSSIRVFNEGGEMVAGQAEEKLNQPVVRTRASTASDTAFIPSGSMFVGVMLNGLDAPTSSVAQKNPTPVVFRIKREALLPNFASIDVRECFLMAAGYGQLASERALMRAESLSCVRNDGQVIESKIDAYIVGSDGKVGVPGRLVSKQGQMIAQSLLAGTLGGIGQSLTKSRVPSLNIDPTAGENIYQSESVSSIAQSGLSGGLGSTTNMIAKFYLDMAKETFPIVEVPAGEVATVIVTRGATLPLKGSTNLQKYIDPNDKSRGGRAPVPQDTATGAIAPTAMQATQDRAVAVLTQAKAATTAAIDDSKTAKPSFENGLGW